MNSATVIDATLSVCAAVSAIFGIGLAANAGAKHACKDEITNDFAWAVVFVITAIIIAAWI